MTEAMTDLLCPFCGYNLRGTPGEVCSECGKGIDRSSLAESQIPWVHRRRIGRVRAFFKTAWMVVWRPGKLAEEMNRPNSLKDAMAFRRVVWVLVCLPVWVFLVTAMLAIWREWDWEWAKDRDLRNFLTFIPRPLAGILWMISEGVFWWGVLGAVSLFVRSKGMDIERQNKAVALSYYLGATWLLLYFFIALVLLEWLASKVGDMEWAVVLVFIFAFIGTFIVAVWRICYVPLVFIKRATHCGMGRVVWAMVGLPLCIAGMAIVALTIPLVAFYVELIRATLH